jgi:hypothetical protein
MKFIGIGQILKQIGFIEVRNMEKEITLGDHKYILEINELGNPRLKRYDEECKMWIVANYTSKDKCKLTRLKEILANEFVQKRAAEV